MQITIKNKHEFVVKNKSTVISTIDINSSKTDELCKWIQHILKQIPDKKCIHKEEIIWDLKLDKNEELIIYKVAVAIKDLLAKEYLEILKSIGENQKE